MTERVVSALGAVVGGGCELCQPPGVVKTAVGDVAVGDVAVGDVAVGDVAVEGRGVDPKMFVEVVEIVVEVAVEIVVEIVVEIGGVSFSNTSHI